MQIGKAIKKARTAKGIEQGKLAKLCNVSQTHLSLIENDKKEPSFKLVRAIEKNLDVPLSVLMYLSISEEDISDEKKDLFKSLNPSIQQLIKTLYISDDEEKIS